MKKLVVLCVLCLLASVTHAELFVNGDMETGAWDGDGSGNGTATNFDTGATMWGWRTHAPVYQATGGSDGGAYMEVKTAGYWNGWDWCSIWQTVAATPGETYQVSAMAKTIAGTGPLKVIADFKDATGTRVDLNGDGIVNNADRLVFTHTPGAEWELISSAFTAPTLDGLGNPFASPITQVLIEFNTARGFIGVDEASMIPEPATMALLGLGGLLLRRRKA